MARIRTIKPEFFQHEELYDLEQATHLPLRVAYSGLWTQADREGRFKWRPKQLKLNVLPYDLVNFTHVLDALQAHGFIGHYRVGSTEYGHVLAWKDHQSINNKEADSVLPAPESGTPIPPVTETSNPQNGRKEDAAKTTVSGDLDANGTRETTRDDVCTGEGNGKEGNGKEGNLRPTGPAKVADLDFRRFWTAYPRKEKKERARKTWRRLKLKPEEVAAIHADLAARIVSAEWTRNDGQYIPQPATYLTDRRWEDETRGNGSPTDKAGLKASILATMGK